MTRIYLIRHAEAEGNLYRRVQGQYNSLVTERGLEQIKALEERFRDVPIDAVYSSDLYRTKKTASAVYLSHGLPLHTDPGLREVAMGAWEDRPWGLVGREDRQELIYFNANDPRWHIPGGKLFPSCESGWCPPWRRLPGPTTARRWRWPPTAWPSAMLWRGSWAFLWRRASRWPTATTRGEPLGV